MPRSISRVACWCGLLALVTATEGCQRGPTWNLVSVEGAVIKDGWKLLYMAPPYGDNEWFLFNLRDDPEEKFNVADANPDKFAELRADWTAYARAVGYIHAEGPAALERMSAEEFFSRYGRTAD